MFPEELMQIIVKYKSDNQKQIQRICNSLYEIIASLKNIQNNMASDLYKISISDDLTDSTEILNDINVLKEQIAYIKSFTSNKPNEVTGQSNSIPDEVEDRTPIFTKKVRLHLTFDDLCPFCNVKFVKHHIYYQRIVDNKMCEESMIGYRCPACNKLFIIDFETEDFDFKNTNITVKKNEEIPPIDIYSVIILSNTLKCSANHKTKDLIAKIPVLNEDGEISYLKINASYCFECNRFTILKDDFCSIKDIIMCKVIDETVEYQNNNESEFDVEQKKSILTQYGYNVQTKKDLSEQQRHIILSSLIESHILTRREVIDHINTLIERGSKIPNWKTATQKWKDDKQFVAEYRNDSLPEVIFNNIVLKYKRPNQSY